MLVRLLLSLGICFGACIASAQNEIDYGSMLPEELLGLGEDEIYSSVPVMYGNAARLGASDFADVVFRMQLNTLMYNGMSDLDGAIRAFQTDLGDEASGHLTVGQIHQLGYRAERTQLGFVSFFAFDAGGFLSEDFARVTGTAELVNETIAYPVNYVRVECRRDELTCRYLQFALHIPDETSFTQTYAVNVVADEYYRVTRWEDEQIDALPFHAHACRINQLSFNFRTNEFFEIARNNSEGDCDLGAGVVLPALDQPRITRIIDGWDIMAETFGSIEDEVVDYYSTEFMELFRNAVAPDSNGTGD